MNWLLLIAACEYSFSLLKIFCVASMGVEFPRIFPEVMADSERATIAQPCCNVVQEAMVNIIDVPKLIKAGSIIQRINMLENTNKPNPHTKNLKAILLDVSRV